MNTFSFVIFYLVWYDIMPSGQWWDYAVKHIPNLLLVYRETPTMIFNQGIEFPEHRSDVTRVEAIVMLGLYWSFSRLLHNIRMPMSETLKSHPSLSNGI